MNSGIDIDTKTNDSEVKQICITNSKKSKMLSADELKYRFENENNKIRLN